MEVQSIVLVLLNITLHIGLNTCCIFHVPFANTTKYRYGKVLDLSKFQNETLYTNDTTSGYKYQYTPCKNGARCGPRMPSMINQMNVRDGSCTVLGYWDNGTSQPFYNNETRQIFVFTYLKGDVCSNGNENIKMQIYWECDEDVAQYRIEHVGPIDGEPCKFQMHIYSKVVCDPPRYRRERMLDLSIGSMTVVLFFTAMFLYCCLGAMLNAIRGKGQQMPHQQFWMRLPLYVIAGCKHSRDIIYGRNTNIARASPFLEH